MTVDADRFVLDSFAVLAYFDGENSALIVRDVLKTVEVGRAEVYLSIMNLGEIAYIFERERGLAMAQQVLGVIDQLPIQQIELTRDRVLAAAHMKASYRMSYADAFVVAAALELDATILTGDPEFKTVEKLVKINWLSR